MGMPDTEVETFARLLSEIVILLDEGGQADWARKVERCLAPLEQSDAAGLYRFLSLFGGMGSLNDVMLQQNAALLMSDNEQLHILLGQAWELGRQLAREAQ